MGDDKERRKNQKKAVEENSPRKKLEQHGGEAVPGRWAGDTRKVDLTNEAPFEDRPSGVGEYKPEEADKPKRRTGSRKKKR